MKLKSQKGLLVTYIEGLILVSVILLIGYWNGYSVNLFAVLYVLITTPLVFILFDSLFRIGKTLGVSDTVGTMGAITIMMLLPVLWRGAIWGLAFGGLFLFIFSQINKRLFPQEQKK